MKKRTKKILTLAFVEFITIVGAIIISSFFVSQSKDYAALIFAFLLLIAAISLKLAYEK